jgi:hypothetical protein
MSILNFIPNAIMGAWNSMQFCRAGGEERLGHIVQEAVQSFTQGQTMSVGDVDRYRAVVDANVSGCGRSIVQDAQKWALSMEKAMEAGYRLNRPLIEASENLANLGFSGASYYLAVQFLAATWVHGPELSRALGSNPPRMPVIEIE